MIFKNIGIDIDENIIETVYRTYQAKQYAKLCEETNFKTGHIAFEDGVFLPEGTYVLIKEQGKKDIVGRIFHYDAIFQQTADLYHEVAIVDVDYDMNSSKSRLEMNDMLVKDFINKNIYTSNKNKVNKYLQVISYQYDNIINNNNDWQLVKVEYGNPDIKMFYMYGYKYKNNEIYAQKDTNSKKLSCFNKYHRYINITEINHNINYEDIQTNVAYKIKSDVLFYPDEIELILITLILLGLTFIFKRWYCFWIVIIIFFFIIRKDIRNKYT